MYSVKGKPATWKFEPIGTRDMSSTPPPIAMSTTPDGDQVRGEMDRLLAGAALAVDRGAGHFDREARLEDDVAADVRGLLADLRDVAEDDVSDLRGSTPALVDDLAQHLRAEGDGVGAGQHAVAAAHGGPYRLDDDNFRGQESLLRDSCTECEDCTPVYYGLRFSAHLAAL